MKVSWILRWCFLIDVLSEWTRLAERGKAAILLTSLFSTVNIGSACTPHSTINHCTIQYKQLIMRIVALISILASASAFGASWNSCHLALYDTYINTISNLMDNSTSRVSCSPLRQLLHLVVEVYSAVLNCIVHASVCINAHIQFIRDSNFFFSLHFISTITSLHVTTLHCIITTTSNIHFTTLDYTSLL